MINKFFDAIDEIPHKNSGGCLFIAYAFYLYLELYHENEVGKFNLVQYDFKDKSAIENNLKWIEGSKGCAKASHHFSFIYDGVEYDAGCQGETELVMAKEYEREVLHGLNTKFINLTTDFCEAALGNGGWNQSFSRNKAANIILQNLNIDMFFLQ